MFNTFCWGWRIGYHFYESKSDAHGNGANGPAGACNDNFVGIGADMVAISVLVEATHATLRVAHNQRGIHCFPTGPRREGGRFEHHRRASRKRETFLPRFCSRTLMDAVACDLLFMQQPISDLSVRQPATFYSC